MDPAKLLMAALKKLNESIVVKNNAAFARHFTRHSKHQNI